LSFTSFTSQLPPKFSKSSIANRNQLYALFLPFSFPFSNLYVQTNIKYLASAPWIQCYTPEWFLLRNVAIAFAVVYVAGVPLFFAYLLFFILPKASDITRYAISSIFSSYSQDRFWYELVIIIKRLWMALSISVLNKGGPASIISTVSALAVSFLVHAMYDYRRTNVTLCSSP